MNSRERQITPWSNDPVINRPGEVFYVRDEDTGELWSPTASPIRDHAAPYVIAHGQGYSRFEHMSRGIELVLEQFLAGDDPVKIFKKTMTHLSWLAIGLLTPTAGHISFDGAQHAPTGSRAFVFQKPVMLKRDRKSVV